MHMELEGTFDTFPLSELLEMLQHSSMCGVLEVKGQHGLGSIWTRDGIICQAEYGGEKGRSAVLKLFQEPGRPFVVRAQNDHPWGPPGIGDAQTLTQQASEYQRTWGEVYKRLPNPDVVPVVIGQPAQSLKLTDLDWTVLMAINGEYSVRELTEPTMLDLLDVCRSVIRLRQMGVIELTERGGTSHAIHPPTHSAPTPAKSPQPPAQGGLIKRKPGIDSAL